MSQQSGRFGPLAVFTLALAVVGIVGVLFAVFLPLGRDVSFPTSAVDTTLAVQKPSVFTAHVNCGSPLGNGPAEASSLGRDTFMPHPCTDIIATRRIWVVGMGCLAILGTAFFIFERRSRRQDQSPAIEVTS